MSGVEVVGLVLGAIPLLISGLEHYAEGVETIRKVRHSSAEFRKIKTALIIQHRIFVGSLLVLLKDEVDEYVLAKWIANIQTEAGPPHASIDQTLRLRLGPDYSAYRDGAEAMANTLEEFRLSLQIRQDGKAPFDIEKRSVTGFLKQLRFGLMMKVYKDFMDSITAQNQALRHLTQQNTMLELFREEKRKAPDFEKARQHALSMFTVLQKSLAHSCNVGHRASLYMKPIQKKSDQRIDSEMLRLVLHHKATSATHTSAASPQWTLEETEVRLLDLRSSDEDSLTQSLKATRFELPASKKPVPKPAKAKEIQDLCESLRTLSATQSGCDICLGYLSGDTKDCRHELYRPEVPIVERDAAVALSLTELLDKQQGYRLGVSDKTELAFALASGMLRLYETPWLAKQWGKGDVLVFKRKGRIAASHPFVSTEVPVSGQPGLTPKQYFTSCRLIKEETIFALGILLIEIALEKSFEELRKPEDLNQDGTKHELSDFYTAEGALDDVCLAAGDRYGEAVSRCIHGNFDQKRKSTLKDPDFRKKVYDGVVAELKADLDDLNL